jgi:type VI secretion system protein ImpM
MRAAAIITGFFGKIPARGDFVRWGLPRGFADRWDEWMQSGLAAGRERLGDGWLEAWLEAPIWRFALAGGVCGEAAAVGLWLPSIDRAGRHFPLMVAALAECLDAASLLARSGAFLNAAEPVGLGALESDLSPEALSARLAWCEDGTLPGVDAALLPLSGSLWWTAGAPRVRASVLAFPGMPDAETFVRMLDAGAGAFAE